ncbi:fimbria/pilus outer membrane usher protein [Burkholderia glumae]|uniref:fimbria/pilus outer membrane usher protein n=1 Tax=Burkholderia glumae TaxID=337 RepID=UPI000F5F156F|nr:fimbria/pilus outer membrane usher protein [Burkholderia glumae]QJW77332.1 fimbrial biogenesis outer membrane usher protein [Burkholderia glumae]RQZ75162.1 fimbrial biogenesis outer membrane usher protein [Burkholderia glumae]
MSESNRSTTTAASARPSRRRSTARCPRRTRLALAVLLFATAGTARSGDALRFNNDFLTLDGVALPVDLDYFAKENSVLPGRHPTLVTFNREPTGLQMVRFVASGDQYEHVVPCITRAMLDDWGVDTARLAASADNCIDLESAIPGATVRYQAHNQSLFVTVPQTALLHHAAGAVDPRLWNYGETAAVANYDISVNHDAIQGDTGATLNLDTAVNAGRWLLRNRNYANLDRGRTTWQPAEFSLSTPLARLGGSLTAGDTSSPSDLFDSFRFRGVTLQSDDGMVPDSLQGYAPVIRGVATSESRVTIRQNGGTVYDKYVPPGPYAIDDLGGAAAGADLDVTITDAAGRVTHYRQPYNTLPIMLRQGRMRYRIAAGTYDGYGDRHHDPFVWAEAERGMGNRITLFGGIIQASRYTARSLGAGLDLGRAGAVSVDLVRAAAALTGNLPSIAYRLRYANSITRLRFNANATLRRYTNAAFLNFDDAMGNTLQASAEHGVRSHEQLTVNQGLGGALAMYASYDHRTYFGGRPSDRILQIGLSGSYRAASYTLSVGNIRQRGRDVSHYLLLTLSLPLGRAANVSYSGNYDRRAGMSQQASVFGSLLRDGRLSYTANASRTRNDSSIYASTTYAGAKGMVALSQTFMQRAARTVAEVKGGIVGDARGVLLSQHVDETSAIVDAPGLRGALVNGNPGIRTNRDGRAVVTGLMPYRRNRIRLDEPQGRDDDDNQATLLQSIATTVPTRGAITRLHFQTAIGWRSLNTLLDTQGKPLPFGAMIRDARHHVVSVVGPLGRVWLTGLRDENDFIATLGDARHTLCRFRITRQERNQPLTCQPARSLAARHAP